MAQQADNIIQIDARISPAGLGFANFASAMLFAADADVTGKTLGVYKTYQDILEVAADFPETTETYKSAAKWMGGTPKMRRLMIWFPEVLGVGETITKTLNDARNSVWWYWTILTSGAYAVEETVLSAADWCEQQASMLVNNQTGAACSAIREENTTTDIASKLTTLGYRHVYTAAHATDAYAGTALAKHFAAVNYSGEYTTITGEFKKSPGVPAEDLKGTEIAAMEKESKNATFYTVVELSGSQDNGRWLNTKTHSTYKEFIDDVVNLDAFINTMTVGLYNALANQVTKLQQTPRGMAVLLTRARQICDQYITNGYLGERNYIDPDDGLEKYTIGYEILTQPEDILDLSPEDRNARWGAPIRIRLFRAGAIHRVIVDLAVY